MTPTRLTLPRNFLEQVGFPAARRPAAGSSPGPDAAPAPQCRRDAPAAAWDPVPAWVGYSVREEIVTINDGRHAYRVSTEHPVLLEMLTCYAAVHGGRLPWVAAPEAEEPGFVLLHDTTSGRTFLEPFEVGNCLLQRQTRV